MNTNETPTGGGPMPAPPTPAPPSPGAPWSGAAPGGTAVLPPVPPAPPQDGAPVPPRRRIPRWVYWVVGILVLALVAGTIVYFLVRGDNKGGASSPAKAAAAIERNIASKDVMALASQVAPSEYAPYAQNLTSLLKDSGLQVAVTGDQHKDPISALGSAKDLLDAVDIDRSEMTFEVAHEGPQLAAVDVTSWVLDASVDREAMEKALEKVGKQQGVESVESMLQDLRESSDEELRHSGEVITQDSPLRLVMVKEDSGWYVSPVLTMVESSRLEDEGTDAAVEPDWDADPNASKGAASPEKAFSEFVDHLLEVKSPADLYADPVVSRLSLPERRILMLYRPYLDELAGEAVGDQDLAELGQLSSMLNIEWGLKAHRIDDSLSIVSMGSTKVSIPMLGSLEFDGAKLSVPMSPGGPSPAVDFGIGLENPDRLGFAAVKDQGGWRLSLLDSTMNFVTLKANDQALAWGEEFYAEEVSGERGAPTWEELPPLVQNLMGVTASFEKAFDQADDGAQGSRP
ncbi:MAG: hypothetical protein ACTH9H_01170 [Galactobacter sp.]